MPLHQTLRYVDDDGNSTVFSSRFLRSLNPASVLLRAAALYALTQRNPEGLNESIRVMPLNDCLFPFINNASTFSNRESDRVDLIIARAEMGNNNTTNAIRNYCTVPANIIGIIPQYNNTIFNNYNSYLDVPNSNFFDEVNAACNSYKEIARFHSKAIGLYEGSMKVSGSSYTELLVSMLIQASGNYGASKVENFGSYTGGRVEQEAFLIVKECLAKEVYPPTILSRIIRDLYKFECVREPATLLTNAMFLQLASMNNKEGYNTIYKVQNGQYGRISLSSIETYMPMAQTGAVNACRCLWRDIMLSQSPDDMNDGNLLLYYRYDYSSYQYLAENSKRAEIKSSDLYHLENNLLFNYILSMVWTNDYDISIFFFLTQFFQESRNDQKRIMEINEYTPENDNPNKYLIDFPILINQQHYIITISITFPMDFTKSVSIGDISIHYFPLAILNKLLLDAYNVDIRLPDQQIEIDLRII